MTVIETIVLSVLGLLAANFLLGVFCFAKNKRMFGSCGLDNDDPTGCGDGGDGE